MKNLPVKDHPPRGRARPRPVDRLLIPMTVLYVPGPSYYDMCIVVVYVFL